MEVKIKALMINKYIGKSEYSTLTIVDLDNGDKMKVSIKGDPDVHEQDQYIFEGKMNPVDRYGRHYFQGVIRSNMPATPKKEGGE